MRTGNVLASWRLVFALALVTGPLGALARAAEPPTPSTQPSCSLDKPMDKGEAPPVTPEPSSMRDSAINLHSLTDPEELQAEVAFGSYTASNTNSATINTRNFNLSLSAGQTITLGTCGVRGASGSGDTFLRLYNPLSAQVALNDDNCGGLLSRLTYTVPVNGTYQLRAGCFANTSCSGTLAYSISGVLFSYIASNTNSATVNTTNVYVNLSAGQIITLGTCGLNEASGLGDTYLRLYGPNGMQVAFNDDNCGGLLSNFTYTVPVSGTYLIRAGCFANTSCSGSVAYLIQ